MPPAMPNPPAARLPPPRSANPKLVAAAPQSPAAAPTAAAIAGSRARTGAGDDHRRAGADGDDLHRAAGNVSPRRGVCVARIAATSAFERPSVVRDRAERLVHVALRELELVGREGVRERQVDEQGAARVFILVLAKSGGQGAELRRSPSPESSSG